MKGTVQTRFKGLGYEGYGRFWYFVDTSDGKPTKIGHSYPTKQELLADIERFAADRALDGAVFSTTDTIVELRKLAMRTNQDAGGDLSAADFLEAALPLLARHGGAV